MEKNRKAIGIRNVLYALGTKVFQLVVPFFIKTLFIYKFGMEYLGLDGVFASILGMISFAELGIGSAIVYSLYRPIAECDYNKVRALLNLYRSLYRYVGGIILSLGLIMIPFIPYIVSKDIPDGINIYIIYGIQLFSTVASYFFFAYKNSILIAYQRNDLVSKISLTTSAFSYIWQLMVLCFFLDYYLYIIVQPINVLINNCIVHYIVKSKYPQCYVYGYLAKKEKSKIFTRIKALVVVKFGSIILNSSDAVIISTFLGLKALGIYMSYYFVIVSVTSLVGLCSSSIVSTIGNRMVEKSIEDNRRIFKILYQINFWLVGVCFICLICLYQDFIALWIGKYNVQNALLSVLLSLSFFCLQSNQIVGAYKDAAGMWVSDKLRPLVTALVNIILSIILISVFGVYGVVLATIISLQLVNMPWLVNNVSRLVFDISPKYYYIDWGINVVLMIVGTLVIFNASCLIKSSDLYIFFMKGIIVFLLANAYYWFIYRNCPRFEESYKYIKTGFVQML